MKTLVFLISVFLCAFTRAQVVLTEEEVVQMLDRLDNPVDISYGSIVNMLEQLEPIIEQYSVTTQKRFVRQLCWNQSLDDLDEYITYADEKLALFANSDDLINQLDLELCRAFYLDLLGETDTALENINSIISRALPLFNTQIKADAFAVRGDIHSYQGEIAKALVDFQQAQSIYERLGSVYYSNLNKGEIARALRRMGDYEGAMTYLNELVEYYATLDDATLLAGTQMDLGLLYLEQEAYENAVSWFNRSIATVERYAESSNLLDEERIDAWAYFYKAEALASLGLAQPAIEAQQKAIALNPSLMDPESTTDMQMLQGKIDVALGRLDSAELILKAALAAYQQQNNYRLQIYAYKALVGLYVKQMDYKKALESRQAQEAIEALYQKQLDRQASELFKIELDIAARDAELERLLLERELSTYELLAAQQARRLQFFALSLLTALLASVAFYGWYKRRQNITLNKLASTDELTGLDNRRAIDHFGEQLYNSATQYMSPISCILFDIDHFKSVNDSNGHAIGDLVIQKLSQAANSYLRAHDRIGRYGGEEFLVILPGADASAAKQVAERIRTGIEALNFDSIQSGLKITVSLGVAERLDHERTPSGTIRRADIALYEAKKQGRNQVKLAKD